MAWKTGYTLRGTGLSFRRDVALPLKIYEKEWVVTDSVLPQVIRFYVAISLACMQK